MDAAPPPLPDGVPADIAAFVGCALEHLELRDGPVTWLPIPSLVRRVGGDAATPIARVRPADPAGWAEVQAGWGPLRLRMVLGVVDGLLAVRFPGWANPLNRALRGDVEAWVQQVNGWLVARGRRLAPPLVEPGRVVLAKVAVP